MKDKSPLTERQVKSLEKIKDELIGIYLSPERFKDTTSNITLLLNGMIRSIDSILSYCKDKPKRR